MTASPEAAASAAVAPGGRTGARRRRHHHRRHHRAPAVRAGRGRARAALRTVLPRMVLRVSRPGLRPRARGLDSSAYPVRVAVWAFHRRRVSASCRVRLAARGGHPRHACSAGDRPQPRPCRRTPSNHRRGPCREGHYPTRRRCVDPGARRCPARDRQGRRHRHCQRTTQRQRDRQRRRHGHGKPPVCAPYRVARRHSRCFVDCRTDRLNGLLEDRTTRMPGRASALAEPGR
jgi:hypothetical protein